ncbi:hypothetical protein RRG08_014171 [Elysia crispata]|uniref:Uncharacterized protein n=1 Tax=Elysia crispata TaxID=231223 RepID=A0AAE0Z5V9_9GAST|nr:hypothetical protein RRG08_014171 [Elysia crispata]
MCRIVSKPLKIVKRLTRSVSVERQIEVCAGSFQTSEDSKKADKWCDGFELGTDACVDHAGQADQCSCVEVTNGSVYRFRLNLTARTQSEQSVWLEWPGPPPIMSKIHVLPKVKAETSQF